MSSKQQCLEALRGFIERADRAELADAQAAIIQYALASPDLKARAQDMQALRDALAEEMAPLPEGSVQVAFYSVVDAMIDRTRDAVLARGA